MPKQNEENIILRLLKQDLSLDEARSPYKTLYRQVQDWFHLIKECSNKNFFEQSSLNRENNHLNYKLKNSYEIDKIHWVNDQRR